jgi:hypothetical protein
MWTERIELPTWTRGAGSNIREDLENLLALLTIEPR